MNNNREFEQEDESLEEQKLSLYKIVHSLRENVENPPVSRLMYAAFYNESIVSEIKIETIEEKIKEFTK
jgi:hypothetical protein